VCHGEFLLGYKAGNQEQHCGDQFLFMGDGCSGDYLSDVFGQVESLLL
jgi:hypothetical protein